MKHLKKFNESVETKTFKNTDSDIRVFFTDYTDDKPDSLTIKNGLIYNGRVVEETTYMKDPSKYRRCKVITLDIDQPENGIITSGGKCMTDLDSLSNVIEDIKRFYALSGEEVNYIINSDYSGLSVTFITLGDIPRSEESQSDKIDGYLQRVKEWIRKKGHKKQTIGGNWLDMRFSKKGAPSFGWDYYVSRKLRKVADGILTLDNTTDDVDRDLINIRNEAWEDGLKFELSGGDNQVVLKLVKR